MSIMSFTRRGTIPAAVLVAAVGLAVAAVITASADEQAQDPVLDPEAYSELGVRFEELPEPPDGGVARDLAIATARKRGGDLATLPTVQTSAHFGLFTDDQYYVVLDEVSDEAIEAAIAELEDLDAGAPGDVPTLPPGAVIRSVAGESRLYPIQRRPVWLVTFTGSALYARGPGGKVPNTEIHVVVDAFTGTDLELFSYK